MDRVYPVRYMGSQIGTVLIQKQGRYYVLQCNCNPGKQSIYRLLLRSGNNEEKLGLLVPDGDRYCAKARINAAKIKEDDVQFLIINERESRKDGLFAVNTQTPFAYLDKLENASMYIVDDKPYIRIYGVKD